MSEKVRVGLIGYGYAGRTFHAPVITAVPNLVLTKVAARSAAKHPEVVTRRYPAVEVVADPTNVYEDDSIDLVVITTPSTDHFSFARDALLAGKHVVVEKPFTTTTVEADELIALAEARGLVLSVFHNRRWDGDFKTLEQIIQQNLLGDIVDAEFRWEKYRLTPDPNRWREIDAVGAGIFYDLGVHFIDQALSLFGRPNTIRAEIRKVRTGALADDWFDVTLGYDAGPRVTLKGSLMACEPGPRYRVSGTNGSFVKFGDDPQEAALKAGGSPTNGADWGVEPPDLWGTLNIDSGGLHFQGRVETLPGSYQNYYQNMADSIVGRSNLVVKPEQARMAIQLIELGLQSSRERRTIEVID